MHNARNGGMLSPQLEQICLISSHGVLVTPLHSLCLRICLPCRTVNGTVFIDDVASNITAVCPVLLIRFFRDTILCILTYPKVIIRERNGTAAGQ